MSFVYSILNLFTSARSEDIKNNAKQLLWKVSLWRNVVLFVGQKQTKKKKNFQIVWHIIVLHLLTYIDTVLSAPKRNGIGQQQCQWSRHMVDPAGTESNIWRTWGDTSEVSRWSIHCSGHWTTCVYRHYNWHAGWSSGGRGTVCYGCRVEHVIWHKVCLKGGHTMGIFVFEPRLLILKWKPFICLFLYTA